MKQNKEDEEKIAYARARGKLFISLFKFCI